VKKTAVLHHPLPLLTQDLSHKPFYPTLVKTPHSNPTIHLLQPLAHHHGLTIVTPSRSTPFLLLLEVFLTRTVTPTLPIQILTKTHAEMTGVPRMTGTSILDIPGVDQRTEISTAMITETHVITVNMNIGITKIVTARTKK
jgi:hypothetical protein